MTARAKPHRLRRYFITGLAIWLPIIVTFYLLSIFFRLVDGALGHHVNLLVERFYGRTIPGLGLLLAVLILPLTGLVASQFFGRPFVRMFEQWLSGLPLVRYIYPPAKQMSDLIFTEEKRLAFRRIVMVPYPSRGLYSLGFVTNEGVSAIDARTGQHMLGVFVPSPPSPLTGNMIFVPEDQVLPLDLSVEEGMALIVSGGIVGPGKGLPGAVTRPPSSHKR